MTDANYGITRSLGRVGFEEALDRATIALAKEGFGILTEIDVKATLKKKIHGKLPKYRILAARNPPLAHGALTAEPLIGLLLPCNVVVFEEDDGTITVSAVKPSEMFKVVDNEALSATAVEVEAKLVRAIELI